MPVLLGVGLPGTGCFSSVNARWRPLARPLLVAAASLIWSLLILLTGLVGYGLLMIAAQVAFAETPTLRRWVKRDAAGPG